MINDFLRVSVLFVKLILNVDVKMVEELNFLNGYRSIGIIIVDSDDVIYIVLDEVIKMVEVVIVYVKLFYGGVVNVNIKLVGEVIGIMVGLNLVEVKSGLNVVIDFIENGGCFYSVNEDDIIFYYVYCVLRIGSYLFKIVGVEEGVVLVYLIVLFLEVMYVLDVVLKVVDVIFVVFFGLFFEINFGGGLLIGS